jgi:membrane-associated phospholipid phosphatase
VTGIEEWGISVILWLQSFSSPATDLFFRLATFLGDEKLLLLLLPLVYWCIDKRLGMQLAVLAMASSALNTVAKLAFGLHRPPETLVRHMVSGEGYGFPSGHTQSATVAFGYLAHAVRRPAAYIAGVTLILAVGLSRVYLGVHFPHDVVGGLAFGVALIILFAWAVPLVERRWVAWPRTVRYLLAIAVPPVAVAVWPVKDMASSLGALAGFAVGALIEVEQVRFVPSGSALQRALRFLLGFAGVAALYFGLTSVLPGGIAWRYVRYGTVGLFGSLVAPWLFVRLRLAARASSDIAGISIQGGSSRTTPPTRSG